MAIDPATGGALPKSYFPLNGTSINGQSASGAAFSGAGSPSTVQFNPTSGPTATYLVTQNTTGTGTIAQVNPPGGSLGNRLTWIERR
jgi:Tfp pilus tip-associated adhesin PilY1